MKLRVYGVASHGRGDRASLAERPRADARQVGEDLRKRRQRRRSQEHRRSDRHRARQQSNARLIDIHHPARSVPLGAARTAAVPAQVPADAGLSGRDRAGNIAVDATIGAGVVDSCAGCHGRPRGSAGFGGDVFTRPDSRDAPHLFGLGLQEMLADEITADLRAIRAQALAAAQSDRDARRRGP